MSLRLVLGNQGPNKDIGGGYRFRSKGKTVFITSGNGQYNAQCDLPDGNNPASCDLTIRCIMAVPAHSTPRPPALHPPSPRKESTPTLIHRILSINIPLRMTELDFESQLLAKVKIA
ncbi:hypothetical protein SNOG_01124 [Parastagonospora nodorum SN15]|uniref:Uncharacterized protein n=1 Tax=Phaeosphaeria nodorum (strain SN15 / ATCC MYA-4574 / FGSC 10173) TaxID=321614 RepID=Q0V4E0_PHANO|nr:hypothetical protein SNOG_01124 [Parastagonospora nodorum SN15]EAT90773.1 hypothetical protein SNOG_01124 [Parastagonospora nodorum SN15]